MKNPVWILLILVFVSACAGGGFQVPLASSESQPETTYSPPSPTRTRLQQTDVVLINGVSKISDLKLNIDGPAAKASLQGTVTIQPMNQVVPVQVPLRLEGLIQADEMTAYMNPINPADLAQIHARAGAALVCLSKDCKTSFIDIYVEYGGQMYRHQVESKNAVSLEPSKTVPEEKAPEKKAPEEEKAEEPLVEDSPAEEREPEIEMGTYVGEPEKDIQILFPDKKPRETPPKEIPSDIKVVQQAIGEPEGGELQNAVNFYEFTQKNPDAGMKFLYPSKNNDYYGTSDLLAVLTSLGKYSLKNMNGYVLRLNTISQREGGPIYSTIKDPKTKKYELAHRSHQNGLDADVGYYYKNPERLATFGYAIVGNEPSSDWLSDKQWELFKFALSHQNVDMIFVGSKIKKELCEIATKNGDLRDSTKEGVAFNTLRALRPLKGHDNHFHLRAKCSQAQKRCKQAAPLRETTTGCEKVKNS